MKKLIKKLSKLTFEFTMLVGLGTIFFVSFHFIKFIKETGFNF
jgi:hypothetical protein